MDLKLDLGLLEQLAADLDSVVKEFENADDFSDSVAESTGHDRLASHVEQFAHNWNDKRKAMTQNVTAMQQEVKAVHDGFSETDDKLAKALEDAASSGDSNYPSPQKKKAA